MKYREKKELMSCSKWRLKHWCGININVKDIKDVEYVARTPFGHAWHWTSDIIRVIMKNGDIYDYLAKPTSIYSAQYEYKLLTASTGKKKKRNEKEVINND